MPVISASSVFSSNPSVIISGVDNGQLSGNEYLFVYNQRSQILAAHDRQEQVSYADFGTKNQRITQIDYSSAQFPGIIARKQINYSLVGLKYRLDSIVWSIV